MENSKMIITIITICLNDLEGLKKTINSVLSQKCKDYEHIVIDGDSTDGTKKYLESTEYNKLKWISEPDRGISDAFNKGIRMAKDSLLICLNAGDVFYDENVIGDVLRDWGKYGVDVLSYPVMRDDGRLLVVNEDKWEKGLLAHQGVFVRKKVYEELGGYNLFLHNRMDYDMFYRFAKARVSHHVLNRVVALFDTNGITTYARYNALREGAALKLIYDKDKYINDVMKEITTTIESRESDECNIQKEILSHENEDILKKKLLIQWLRNVQNGKSISDVLKKDSIKSVSVYGCGEIGMLIINELADKIIVKEAIDRNANNIKIKQCKVVSIDRIDKEVDLIIISVIGAAAEIAKEIKTRYGLNVMTIRELITKTSKMNGLPMNM